jgi:RIO kinase 1
LSRHNTIPDFDSDEYENYAARFDPLQSDRKARRHRKPEARHIAKKSERTILEEIAETTGLEGGFEITYHPALFEEGWLLDSLRAFYEQDLISDVLARVRGGKEANVYCCRARPSTGVGLLAAKVYRPRMFRNLRNDKAYREGRTILTAEGRPVNKNEHRIMRAIGKKTAFGEQVAHTSWLMHEYTALQRLHTLGGAVPKPFIASENSILMGYCGDESTAAPTLNGIGLADDEVAPLFNTILHNVELMLSCGLVHGDLSAYNVLYWRGAITLIDFPQVVEVSTNRNARAIFERDVRRICEYFADQGLERDPDLIAAALWERHVKVSASAEMFDLEE